MQLAQYGEVTLYSKGLRCRPGTSFSEFRVVSPNLASLGNIGHRAPSRRLSLGVPGRQGVARATLFPPALKLPQA